MKEEIKDILDRLFVYRNENNEMKYQPEDILTIEDVWLLLDCITNLQQENEELKVENEKLTQLWLSSQEKRRKAIKYLKQPYRDNFDYSKSELMEILGGDEE
jgi:hypothetical protein